MAVLRADFRVKAWDSAQLFFNWVCSNRWTILPLGESFSGLETWGDPLGVVSRIKTIFAHVYWVGMPRAGTLNNKQTVFLQVRKPLRPLPHLLSILHITDVLWRSVNVPMLTAELCNCCVLTSKLYLVPVVLLRKVRVIVLPIFLFVVGISL